MATYYPDELVNEVIAANDIVDVISNYVRLKKSGSDYKGLCPFHGEKTPSFSVTQKKQFYHCFGCGAGGSVLQFVMNLESLDFVEALKFLAQRVNIPLPEGDGNTVDGEVYAKKQELYKLNAVASKHFYNTLYSDKGSEARAYLLKRGLDSKTITNFGLGYAIDSFDSCINHLLDNGFKKDDILDAGLAKISEKTSNAYDFFRGRIIFPIIDIRGNVIAFGGRVMENVQPKYINSPDTLVFNKSRTLFALNIAKATCSEQLILCEGYMDVIALHKEGITNAVATLGTAITGQHTKIIQRYTKEVVICYDSDEAGKKATSNAIELLKSTNVKTRVITLEGAKDPDEYIKKWGVNNFKNQLQGSKNAVIYKIDKLEKEYNIDVIDEKIELLNKMAQVFSEVENAIERDVLVRDTATRTGISEESIFTEINKLKYKNSKKRNNYNKRTNEVNGTFGTLNKGKNDDYSYAQGLLVSLICEDIRVYHHFKDEIKPDFFDNLACRQLLGEIYRLRESGLNFDLASVMSTLNPDFAKELTAYFANELPYEDNIKASSEIIEKIKEKKKIIAAKNTDPIASAEKLDMFIKSLRGKK